MQGRRVSDPLRTLRVVGTVTSMLRPGGTADKTRQTHEDAGRRGWRVVTPL